MALALLAACELPLVEPAAPDRIALGSSSAQLVDGGRSLRLLRGENALLTFPTDAFVLGTVPELSDKSSYDPYWQETDDMLRAPPPAGLVWRTPTGARVESMTASDAVVRLTYDGATALLTLHGAADGRWRAHLVPTVSDGEAVAWMRLRLRASASEGFYGLGEWGDSVEHHGKLRPMQMEADLASESADDENHVPVPLLVGTRGWGVFVESRRVGLFDVARKEPDLVEITYGTAEESAQGLVFHLFSADRALDVTKLYYDVTGYPALPAHWALGPWIWRDENLDQAQVLDDIAKIRSLDLATSGLWIDRPYATAVNTFDFDAEKFPDPAAIVRAAHEAGLRMALWSTPYLEPDAQPLRGEAEAKGYFVPTPGPQLNRWSTPIDFTKPDAYAWWQGLVRRYTDAGIEGFKLDYAEDVVAGIGGARTVWKFFDGSDERTMHYRYNLLYHRVYADTLPASGGFLLCRAGRWGDQRNVSVVWPGDLDASFAKKGDLLPDGKRAVGGLPASVAMGLGLGVSGFPFYGSDTGGYRASPPGRETYVRWFEQTALSSVMQVGDSSSQPPWEFTPENGRDETVLALYRDYARLHLRLFPYEWSYAQNLLRDGRPIQRPLGLAYPETGAHPADTYLFGDHLLVAPVVEEGATTRRVMLPPGTWFDWWDGTRYDGGAEREIPAPIERLPLLLRAGGIVPMLRPDIDTLAPVANPDEVQSFTADAGRLYARVATGSPGEFVLWDGARIALGNGTDGSTVMETRDGTVFRQGTQIEIDPRNRPDWIQMDGVALEQRADEAALNASVRGWIWIDARGGTLAVRLPAGTHRVELR